MAASLITLSLLGAASLLGRPALATPLPEEPIVAMPAEDGAEYDGLADDDEEEEDEKKDDDLDFGGDDLDLDVFKDAGGEEEEKVKRLDQADTIEEEEDESQLDDLDFGGDQEEVFDFEDDEEEVPIGGPGQDTARIYRDYKNNIEDLGPDEEIIQWERYLEDYPNSLFLDRIQARIDELSEAQYDERVPQDGKFEGVLDAGLREIGLSVPRQLEPIDPRTKIRAGFEWGFPEYINLMADFEYQIFRPWSVHGGVRNRFTGWNLELGTRYALIKSARTNFLLTGILDFHLNTLPLYPALRPQLGLGKRFLLGKKALDIQLQGGVDLELRLEGVPMGMVLIGGGNITYQASEKVFFFVEGIVRMKNLGWEDGGSFRFPMACFGITFWMNQKNTNSASIAANAPFYTNYWGYHFGGVMGDFNFYPDF